MPDAPPPPDFGPDPLEPDPELVAPDELEPLVPDPDELALAPELLEPEELEPVALGLDELELELELDALPPDEDPELLAPPSEFDDVPDELPAEGLDGALASPPLEMGAADGAAGAPPLTGAGGTGT